MPVKALLYKCENVGKTFKSYFKFFYFYHNIKIKTLLSSKKKFIWTFSIDSTEHRLELFASLLSGKKKLVHNGKVIYKEQK